MMTIDDDDVTERETKWGEKRKRDEKNGMNEEKRKYRSHSWFPSCEIRAGKHEHFRSYRVCISRKFALWGAGAKAEIWNCTWNL